MLPLCGGADSSGALFTSPWLRSPVPNTCLCVFAPPLFALESLLGEQRAGRGGRQMELWELLALGVPDRLRVPGVLCCKMRTGMVLSSGSVW